MGEGLVARTRVGRFRCRRRLRRRRAEELPTAGELVSPVAMAEAAVVPHAVEAGWQHVQQEPAQALTRGERHRVRVRMVLSIILVADPHLPVLDVEESGIGDGDAVRVAPDVIEHLLRSGEGRCGRCWTNGRGASWRPVKRSRWAMGA